MGWLAKTILATLGGIAFVSALDRLGLYQAREIVQFFSDLIETRILAFIFWPFRLIEIPGFSITPGEEAVVLIVWTIIIVPGVKNADLASDNYLILIRRPPFPIRFIFSVFSALVSAFLLGVITFVLPDLLSRIVLLGWMCFILATIMQGSIAAFTVKPATEEDAYELRLGRERARIAWLTYAETAVAIAVVIGVDRLFGR